ncbi:hypothetical protein HMPREF0044_0451 [Gleimia coleocanis DSM 15436]|uniref:Uncharacterized protein n=1 Tax=Gleimia coleocanis DSM 15436 TaxID=525245 RepID=C0VZ61_9ACTO|nr:hypothetical protein [Gleimia coleocanis]EEH64714.1 hypothetical protein HMPREF0044_0451 [Gleimia coleocanis DSM 15436]
MLNSQETQNTSEENPPANLAQSTDKTLAILSRPQPKGMGTGYVKASAINQRTKQQQLKVAFGWALFTLLFLALPTDIIPNPIFAREVPIRWWEYPVVFATVALTFAWFAIQIPPEVAKTADKQNGRLIWGVTLALFAVACPVCNKIILLLMGTAGALGTWAPLQPYIAVGSLLALGAALWLRIRTARGR